MLKYLLCIALTFSLLTAKSQNGGEKIWRFLDIPVSGHATALGGQQISIYDDDLNFAYYNPSLLNPSMSNTLTLSYIDYLADIKYAYVSYARTIEKYGNFALGISHFDYGEFIETNIRGDKLGTFNKVYDYSINAMYSRPLIDSMLFVGGTLKAIGSQYEYWDAFGLALDAGITYHNPNRLFTAALVFKNMGSQVNTYYEGADYEPIPFQIQLGITQKLMHAPFRLSVLAQHLETPNQLYEVEGDEPEFTNIDGEEVEDGKLAKFGDNLMRHVVLGLEFVPGNNFNLRLGYNYKRQKELAMPEKVGFAGFSWGFGIRIYKFHIDYGRSRYHLAAVTNHFTLSINLNEFNKKF